MNRINLVLIWHMHQPQYRDPSTGRYILPWTRLHALKDYWGMVRTLEEFPQFHATVNVVPSMAMQLEEYATGHFNEPWFTLAFSPAGGLTAADKAEIVERAFQITQGQMRRWPRFGELFDWVQQNGRDVAVRTLGLRDWRDLQLLSQLAWMDEEYLAKDPVVSQLSEKGRDFSEADKDALRAKQLELLAKVWPEYRTAQQSGQIELSTTPFYHPILPLVCDSDIAKVSNPWTPLPQPAFRHPEDAREQLARARKYHEGLFGSPPAGVWPSEGSVSDQALTLAAELGFRWFASDEGVLGRTLNIGFGRDADGVPWNAEKLYSPLRMHFPSGQQITGFFRDHQLSDLVGFVYSRMDSRAAAEDFHRRLRLIGERVQIGKPLTVSVILDGENAWEYFPGNGREFLRQFYRLITEDPDIHPLKASEALEAAGDIPEAQAIFPGSWINANFDVWIGHQEDVTGWDYLRDARDFYSGAAEKKAKGAAGAPSDDQLASAFEALLAAEGSDWFWWFGPEHSSANDAEFDSFFRKLLSEVYRSLHAEAPDQLAEPIKHVAEQAQSSPPTAFLTVRVDGRESSYFEWMGAGVYLPIEGETSMHGKLRLLKELHYGFSNDSFFLRVDFTDDSIKELRDAELRITLRGQEELRILVHIRESKVSGYTVENKSFCLLNPAEVVSVALDRTLEASIARKLVPLGARQSLSLAVTLWEGGLPLDLLPAEGWLDIPLGEKSFSWSAP